MVRVIKAVIRHFYTVSVRTFRRCGSDWSAYPAERFRGRTPYMLHGFVWPAFRVDDELDMLNHECELHDCAMTGNFAYLDALGLRSQLRIFADAAACLLIYYLRADVIFELLQRSMRGQYYAEEAIARFLFSEQDEIS